MDDRRLDIPWWWKMLLGGIGIFLIWKFTPILQILQLTFYIVLIPLLLLAAIGLVGRGAVEGFTGGFAATMEAARHRAEELAQPQQ